MITGKFKDETGKSSLNNKDVLSRVVLAAVSFVKTKVHLQSFFICRSNFMAILKTFEF